MIKTSAFGKIFFSCHIIETRPPLNLQHTHKYHSNYCECCFHCYDNKSACPDKWPFFITKSYVVRLVRLTYKGRQLEWNSLFRFYTKSYESEVVITKSPSLNWHLNDHHDIKQVKCEGWHFTRMWNDEEYCFNTQTIYRSDSSFPSHITDVVGSVLASNVRATGLPVDCWFKLRVLV